MERRTWREGIPFYCRAKDTVEAGQGYAKIEEWIKGLSSRQST
jgi:hypothetical protein